MLISIENKKKKPNTEESKNIHFEFPEKINHSHETENRYPDSSLALTTLAKELHTNREYLSLTTSHCFGNSYSNYTNEYSIKTALEIPDNNPFTPRSKTLPLRSNSFTPRGKTFPLRSNSFTQRGKTFPLRNNSFTPRGNSFPLRSKSFIPRSNSFPLRSNSFIPLNKCFFLQDKSQLSENISTIHTSLALNFLFTDHNSKHSVKMKLLTINT